MELELSTNRTAHLATQYDTEYFQELKKKLGEGVLTRLTNRQDIFLKKIFVLSFSHVFQNMVSCKFLQDRSLTHRSIDTSVKRVPFFSRECRLEV